MGTCTIGDCGSSVRARQMCNTHYMRWLRTGNPYTTRNVYPPRGLSTEERLRHHIEEDNECWLFKGSIHPQGYAFIFDDQKKRWQAHRLAYVLWVGEIPEHLELDHGCRNKACVNPDHIEAVTHSENCLRKYLSAEEHMERVRKAVAARKAQLN